MPFAHKHRTHESIIEGVRREDHGSVPLVAIREALMNAVVHADYAQLWFQADTANLLQVVELPGTPRLWSCILVYSGTMKMP